MRVRMVRASTTMPKYTSTDSFDHGAPSRIGVLLCNLGTPAGPTPRDLRRYLAEFLADPRLVELPRLLWMPILHGIILNTRPRRSARAYAKIWTVEGSPLLAISRRQAAGLAARLETTLPGRTALALGMRYGEPSIAAGLRELRAAGARRVLVLPLYPQYAAATSASIFDAASAELACWRWVPDFRFVSAYHAEPEYLDALAASVREHRAAHGTGEHLVMSFHGIPKAYFLAGDPYYCHCQETARLLAARLGLTDENYSVSFQSRFGPKEWLKPYTDARLGELAARGMRRVDVICPGFAADCLETLEEIAIQYGERFKAAGGEQLSYVPALNDRADHLSFLQALVLRQIRGWPEAEREFDAAAGSAAAARARALGAPR